MRARRLLRGAAGALLAVSVAAGCGDDDERAQPVVPVDTIEVTSPAFEDGGEIPERYSCEGENVPPPLEWEGVPAEAKALAILIEDPDAPGGVFTHWAVWNLDASLRSIEDGAPDDAVVGAASSGKAAYIGPCPPAGHPPHRYRFEVIALSAPLPLDAGAEPEVVRDEIEELALSSGILTGRFSR